MLNVRVGHGYDIHRLIPKRKLVIGGVKIPFPKGPDAHSDGDVLIHAIVDALLGAFGRGDIGTHFPNSDPKWKNADSTLFLKHVAALLADREWAVVNIDATVIAEAPKLAKYIPKMKQAIGKALGVDNFTINIKAATNEGCDAIGRGEAIAAHAVVLIELRPRTCHPFQLS